MKSRPSLVWSMVNIMLLDREVGSAGSCERVVIVFVEPLKIEIPASIDPIHMLPKLSSYNIVVLLEQMRELVVM